jgi:hypothetical protein
VTTVQAASDTVPQDDEYVRLPGVFAQWEIASVLVPGSDFRIEPAGNGPDGTPLFALHARMVGRARTSPAPKYSRVRRVEPSLGEIKARRRDEHLCLACSHHQVCKMSSALDENLLVTITHCLGFEAVDGDPPYELMELTPLEPIAGP